jgi:sulfatase maturation enzyme AslB (radical SAM superfamily)
MSRFCPAPWITISTDVNGSIRPCCRYEQPQRQTEYKMPWMKDGDLLELYNGSEMQAVRQAFLDGKEPQECNWCWSEESVGIKSFRQKYLEKNYSYSTTYAIPQILDLKLSNVCNLKCRMCGPQASSSIAKEENKQKEYWLSSKIIGTENEQLFFEQWLPNMKELELTGGEPFFSKENKLLISKIVDSGFAQNIKISITTNAMFYIPTLLEKINSFKKVTISLSVDDIESRLEYARSGAKWDIIDRNIKLLLQNYPQFEILIYRTVNCFNIFYLDELDRYALDSNINVVNGVLHSPDYLSIKNLPYWAKEEVSLKFKDNTKYSSIIDFMYSNNQNLIKEFRSKTNKLDSMRKDCFASTFDDWAEILLWK